MLERSTPPHLQAINFPAAAEDDVEAPIFNPFSMWWGKVIRRRSNLSTEVLDSLPYPTPISPKQTAANVLSQATFPTHTNTAVVMMAAYNKGEVINLSALPVGQRPTCRVLLAPVDLGLYRGSSSISTTNKETLSERMICGLSMSFRPHPCTPI